jgi:hypothetical protein
MHHRFHIMALSIMLIGKVKCTAALGDMNKGDDHLA